MIGWDKRSTCPIVGQDRTVLILNNVLTLVIKTSVPATGATSTDFITCTQNEKGIFKLPLATITGYLGGIICPDVNYYCANIVPALNKCPWNRFGRGTSTSSGTCTCTDSTKYNGKGCGANMTWVPLTP